MYWCKEENNNLFFQDGPSEYSWCNCNDQRADMDPTMQVSLVILMINCLFWIMVEYVGVIVVELISAEQLHLFVCSVQYACMEFSIYVGVFNIFFLFPSQVDGPNFLLASFVTQFPWAFTFLTRTPFSF